MASGNGRKSDRLTREDILREIREVKQTLQQNTDTTSRTAKTTERLVTMIGGDPLVIDKNDPRSFQKSVMGQLEAGVKRDEGIEETVKRLMARVDERLNEQDQKLEEERLAREKSDRETAESMQAALGETFGWPTVTAFLKRHWWKIVFGILFLVVEGPRAVERFKEWAGS